MPGIEYFYSLMSPFTYLAGLGLEEVAASHDVEIVYRPTDIAAVFNETGGLPVPKRHPFRQEYRLQELKRLSAMHDMPLTISPKHWPVDVRLASCCVLAVIAHDGDGGPISHAFLKACWAEERDISDPDQIAEILEVHGYAMDELSDAIEAARAEYAANTQRAIDNGVFGAPFYVVDGERFWGQDRLVHLDWHLGNIA